jgi:hypothetical protein
MTITQTKTPRLSRGDRLKLKTNTVLARMRAGECLILEHRWFGRCWSLTNGEPVDDEVAKAVVRSPRVVGVGDSLFKNCPSQTWRWVGD